MEIFDLFEGFNSQWVDGYNKTSDDFNKDFLPIYGLAHISNKFVPLIDDRIIPNTSYLIQNALNVYQNKNSWICIGNCSMVEAIDRNFTDIVNVFGFYEADPKLGVLSLNYEFKLDSNQITI